MATKHTVGSEVKELQDDLRRLRSDLASLAKALLNTGSSGAREARDRVMDGASAGVDKVQELLHSLSSTGRHATERVEESIGRHPFASLLSAIGLGFLLGRFLQRD